MNGKEYIHLFSIHPDRQKEFEVWLIDDRTIDVEVYAGRTGVRTYRDVSLSTVKRLSDLASAI